MRKGFTLIELLVFIAIFALIIGSFIAILVSVINTQTRQIAISEVEQQGQFLTQQIQYYVQSARLVDMPLDSATTTLTLRESTSSINPTILSLSNGTIYLSQGLGGAPSPLTSNKVTISNVSFIRHYNLNSVSSALGSDSVSYSFTVTSGNGSVSTSTSNIYNYSRAITVSSNASGTNANFPMLFSGTYAWLAASSSAGRIQNLTTAPNGSQEPADLIFSTSASCASPLNYETESYNASTGAIIDWVNVPSLSAGTVIYACYGNPGVTSDQSHPAATWNSNYSAVYHLPNGTTLSANDSTANGNNGTLVNLPTATTGQIGGGMNLVAASNQYINTTDTVSPTASTYEAWIKPASFPNAYNSIFEKSTGSSAYLDFHVKSNGTLACYVTATGGNVNYDGTGVNTLVAGTWYYVAMSYDSTNGLKCYVNGGVDGAVSALGNISANTAPLYIGNDQIVSPRYFNGIIDEAKFSTVALSSSWILTEYRNQNSPSTFYAVGSETGNGQNPPNSAVFQSSVAVLAPVPRIALIQQVKGENNSASVSSIATAFPSNNENGSLLVAVVANKGNVTSSIADTQGNTWNLLASTTYPFYSEKLTLYAVLNATNGANTATVTFASGASYGSVFLYEYRDSASANNSSYLYYRAITVTSTTSIASGTNANFPHAFLRNVLVA